MIKRRTLTTLALSTPWLCATAVAAAPAPYTRVHLEMQLRTDDRPIRGKQHLLTRLGTFRSVYIGPHADQGTTRSFLLHLHVAAHSDDAIRLVTSLFDAETTARLSKPELVVRSGEATELLINAEPGKPKLTMVLTPRFVSSQESDDSLAERAFRQELATRGKEARL